MEIIRSIKTYATVRENTENEPMKQNKMNVFTLKLMDHLGVLIRIGN